MPIPKSTLDIDCLMEAMSNYHDAKEAERRAYNAYQGYSWGYYGSDYIEAVARAAEAVREHLTAVIQDAVRTEIREALGGALQGGETRD